MSYFAQADRYLSVIIQGQGRVDVGGTTLSVNDPQPTQVHFLDMYYATCIAYPDPGWAFDHWMIDNQYDVRTETTTSINVQGSHDVWAVFKQVSEPPPATLPPGDGTTTTTGSPLGAIAIGGAVLGLLLLGKK